jgi:hypothetical protein
MPGVRPAAAAFPPNGVKPPEMMLGNAALWFDVSPADAPVFTSMNAC